MSFYNYLMNNEVEDLEEKLKLKDHKGFDFLLFPYCKEWGNAVEYSKFLEETAILSSLGGGGYYMGPEKGILSTSTFFGGTINSIPWYVR